MRCLALLLRWLCLGWLIGRLWHHLGKIRRNTGENRGQVGTGNMLKPSLKQIRQTKRFSIDHFRQLVAWRFIGPVAASGRPVLQRPGALRGRQDWPALDARTLLPSVRVHAELAYSLAATLAGHLGQYRYR
jgi:hypothetical protein